MAKKNNKNYAKYLPKAGGAVAVAMAMSVALANPVSAAENEEILPLIPDPAPADAGMEAAVPAADSAIVPLEANQDIEEANEEIAAENQETAEGNEQTDTTNEETADSNEEITGGELEAPELDLPEAPELPDTDGMDEDAYNEAVGDYNQNVDDYNQNVDEYNQNVDDYNGQADQYDQNAQEKYEEDLKNFEDAKTEHENAESQYEEDLKQYEENSKAYQDYLDAKADYEQKLAQYEEDLAKYRQDQAQYDENSQAYQDYLKAQEEYELAKKTYEDELAQYNQEKEQHDKDSAAYDQYLEDMEQFEEEQKTYEEELDQYEQDKEQHEKDSAAYEQYLKDLAKYESDKAAYDIAQTEYEQKLAQYEQDSIKYQNYVDAKADYDAAYLEYQNKMTEYNELKDQYDIDSDKYQEYLDAVKIYEEAKTAYDKVVEDFHTEDAIFDAVTDYNEIIENKNDNIASKNDALENGLHAEAVTDLSQVGDLNQAVNEIVGKDVLDVLGSYDDLVKQQDDLKKAAAALEAHSGKDNSLGSAEYADYLAAVEAYNELVTQFNVDAEAYNAAVEAYNKEVNTYNENKSADVSNSTGSGTEQGTADIDWGNVNFDTYGDHLTHMDVKYNAAASKEVTVETDANGKETTSYSDSVTQYTVTGVYKDKETADQDAANKAEAEEEDKDENQNGHHTGLYPGFYPGFYPGGNNDDPDNLYGLSYSNDNWKTSKDQELKKDATYDEFGNTSWNHTGESLDPVTGQVRFYVTLNDSEGKTHGITVNIDANSVYAEGSFYRADPDNDYLQHYVGKNNKKLKTVEIDNVEYYDISGESVFLISALTCDGMVKNGGKNNQPVTLTAHGLDLILNMQTMIEIHQADNANTINYIGYELGKTAQADAPTNPGAFDEEKPDHMDEPAAPQLPEFNEIEPDPVDEPTEPTAPTAPTLPDEVADPGDAPTVPTAPTAPDAVENPGDAPIAPTAPTAPDVVENPGDAPVAPTAPIAPDAVENPGDAPVGPGNFDQTQPEAPEATGRLEYVEKLDKLDNKIVAEILPNDPADPNVPGDPGFPGVFLDDDFGVNELLNIPDEEVPLAKAPQTGDLSGLWAALSFLSLGGIGILNKKRKNEDAV